MQKTYNKTAALVSNSCKAVAYLSGQREEVATLAFEYGKNLVCIGRSSFFWLHYPYNVLSIYFNFFFFFLKVSLILGQKNKQQWTVKLSTS